MYVTAAHASNKVEDISIALNIGRCAKYVYDGRQSVVRHALQPNRIRTD